MKVLHNWIQTKYPQLEDIDKVKIGLVLIFAFIGSIVSLSYWAVHPLVNLNVPRWVFALLPSMLSLSVFAYHHRISHFWVSQWVIASHWCCLSLGMYYSGGFGSLVVPWLSLMPVLANFILSYRQAAIWFGISILSLFGFIYLQDHLPDVAHKTGIWRAVLSYTGLALILFFFTSLFDRSIYKLLRNLRLKQEELQHYNEQINLRSARLETYWQSILEVARHESVPNAVWEVTLEMIVREAAKALKITKVSVWLYHKQKDEIECIANFSSRAETVATRGQVLTKDMNPPYFEAIKWEHVLLADDVLAHEETKAFSENYFKPLDIKSLMDTPFFIGNDLGGILCFENQGKIRKWESEDILYALSLGELVSLAHRANMRREFEKKISQQNAELQSQQEEIQRINKSLEARVEERTREILLKNEQLAEYAYINSHKLRGPLARILGLIEVLLADKATALDPGYLDKLKSEGNQLDLVIKQINQAIDNQRVINRNDIG